MTTRPTTRSHELAAARLGRDLTRGETRIDLVRLDRAMASAKERLVAEIERQRRKGYRAVLAGRPFRIERTPAMDAILTELYETGVDAAREEIRLAGYDPDALPRALAELPTTLVPLGRSLDARLAALGRDTQARILATDLSGLSTSAILSAFQAIPGARAVAADFISTPLLNGMGDVWTQADAAGIVERWVYSAILDAATCPVCESLDGDEYDSWEEIQVVLPDGGPNPECDGGDRCRCRAVPELADPTDPTGYPAPDAPPPGYDALLGRPAIDDGLAPLATDEGATVADLVPGPEYEYRAAAFNERIYRATRWAEDRGTTPEALVAEMNGRIGELVQSAEPRIRVRNEVLTKVLDDGRFKSQFETNTSGGALNQNLRATEERKMFGYPSGPVDELDPELRPIYGYLEGANEEYVGHYGDVRVVLRDDVKRRSTFTLDDSLGSEGVPQPIYGADPSLAYSWMREPPREIGSASLRDLSGAYPELQIHGGLSIDDIAEVVMPAWSPSSYWIEELRRLDVIERALLDSPETPAVSEGLSTIASQRAAIAPRVEDPYVALTARLDELGIRVRRVVSLD